MGEPPTELLRDLEAKFDAAGSQLRAVDIRLSPSLTRRYFEKVRPTDAKIPFHLLRFYASYPQTDEDLLDKVDYLATVLAAGSPDPAALLQRSRGEIRELFDSVLAGSAWPRVDDDTATEIARAFDEVAAQIASVTGFGSLAEEGWIESLRNFKRQVSRGLAHPEILTAAALCSLAARAAFRRLYEREERILRGATRRIEELEHRSSLGEMEGSAALRLFEDARRELDRQIAEGSVRWRQLLEAQQAASEALKMLGVPELGADEETGTEAEATLGGLEDPFWGPCLRRMICSERRARRSPTLRSSTARSPISPAPANPPLNRVSRFAAGPAPGCASSTPLPPSGSRSTRTESEAAPRVQDPGSKVTMDVLTLDLLHTSGPDEREHRARAGERGSRRGRPRPEPVEQSPADPRSFGRLSVRLSPDRFGLRCRPAAPGNDGTRPGEARGDCQDGRPDPRPAKPGKGRVPRPVRRVLEAPALCPQGRGRRARVGALPRPGPGRLDRCRGGDLPDAHGRAVGEGASSDLPGQVSPSAAGEVAWLEGCRTALPGEAPRPGRQPGIARDLREASGDHPLPAQLPGRSGIPRGRNTDDAAGAGRRARPAFRDAPQRSGSRALPANRARAVLEEARRGGPVSRLRDQPQFQKRRHLDAAQPGIHDARVLPGLCAGGRSDDADRGDALLARAGVTGSS